MKSLIIIGITALLMSCSAKKPIAVAPAQNSPQILKSELYFDDCDSILAFLKAVIINNNSDISLKAGNFRIPFISSSYENTRSLFPDKCFVGISTDDLIAILGKWDYSGKSTYHPAWYVLEYPYGTNLVIEVWIRDKLVEKFKVVPSSNDAANPLNKN